MQATGYENLSRHELECRLNFFENQLKYMAAELSKANEKTISSRSLIRNTRSSLTE